MRAVLYVTVSLLACAIWEMVDKSPVWVKLIVFPFLIAPVIIMAFLMRDKESIDFL
jgi:putative effector of murein hydrolase